jgi:hypothetical protein
MSFHFHLYRAKEGLGPMTEWEEMHAVPLGPVEAVKSRLSAIFPQLEWKQVRDHWTALSSARDDEAAPYLDVMLGEETPGQCHFVVLNKAPPSVMRKIMEAMDLNYVCSLEANSLVDPYGYEDGDRYFAKPR